jgi:cysteine desulfurase
VPAGHIVSSRVEHRSVLDALKQLERDGFAVTLLEPDEAGRILPDAVRAALRADTRLVSVMHSNNEIGCVTDVAGIAAVCRERGVLLHSDASQSAGKLPLDVVGLDVDFLSFTAHKLYGPKGIGALVVRERARPRIAPIVFGGGHERGLRPGTLPTHQIAGFGAAAEIASAERCDDDAASAILRGLFEAAFGSLGALENSPHEASLPGLLNVSFEGVEGESLVTGLTEIAVSTGSACSSASREPSYVLRALGRDTELAQSSLRLSFGRFTTSAEVETAAHAIRREVLRLRELAGAPRGALPPRDAAADASPDTLLAVSLNPLARRYFLAPARPLPAQAAGRRRGQAGRRSDGTELTFEFEIDGGFVKSARFTAYGCPHTLAVVQWLCEVLEGARPEAGVAGNPAEWAEKFAVPPEKLGRLLIVEDALRAALC